MKRQTDIFREERLQLIIEMLLKQKKVYVKDLSQEFDLSPSSVRNDLAELQSRGLLVRTYGGAILPEKLDSHLITQKTDLQEREVLRQAEKVAIGKATADLISDGDTLMIDGGSTTLYVARYLKDKKNLTVITSSLTVIPALSENPDTSIYLSGGHLLRKFRDMTGEISLDTLARFRPNKAILGIDGFSMASGLTATDPPVAANKRKIIAVSQEVIVVCDHTKFDKVCLMPVATPEEIDYVVTDHNTSQDTIDEIRSLGTKVIVASPEND